MGNTLAKFLAHTVLMMKEDPDYQPREGVLSAVHITFRRLRKLVVVKPKGAWQIERGSLEACQVLGSVNHFSI
jgi:hypothetical protein